jgi:hypothetical protein
MAFDIEFKTTLVVIMKTMQYFKIYRGKTLQVFKLIDSNSINP